MPSNPRPTTRECVHLVTRGHFRSRDKDGGHTTRSAITGNPMLHANFIALCFIEPKKILPIEVLHCGNRDFRFLLLWPWPWPDNLYIWTWPVFPGDILGLCFIELELWPIEVLHCGNRDFRPFCSCNLDLDPMTFIYELDLYFLDIYRMCKYELHTSELSKGYRLTNRQTDR